MAQDSGYGTQTQSPDGKSASSTRNSCLTSTSNVDTAGTTSRGQPVPSAVFPVPGLAVFDKDVDDAIYAHFQHVHRQIEGPLLAYIQSKLPGRTYRPISVRLMVLGRTETDAKPSIVVLCQEQNAKKVRKFFDKGSVKSLCQPGNKNLPSFNVFVVGRPPETKDGDDEFEVLIPALIGGSLRPTWALDTYCGAPIIVRQPSGAEKRCTLGGVVKSISADGDVKLYGLTVGHVLNSDLETDDDCDHETIGTPSETVSPSSVWDLELSDSDSDASSDDYGPYVDWDDEEKKQEGETSVPVGETALEDPPILSATVDSFAAWACSESERLGSISDVSRRLHSATNEGKMARRGAYFDWALIDLYAYKPNLVRPRQQADGETRGLQPATFKPGELQVAKRNPLHSRKRQAVVVVSGSEGLKRGFLSPLPSKLLLSPGQEFIDTLVLNLEDNQGE